MILKNAGAEKGLNRQKGGIENIDLNESDQGTRYKKRIRTRIGQHRP